MVFDVDHAASKFIDVDGTNFGVVVDRDIDIKLASCYFGVICNGLLLSFVKTFG